MKKIAPLIFFFTLLLASLTTLSQSISFRNSYGFADYSYGASLLQLPDTTYVLLGNSGNNDGNAKLLFIRTDLHGAPMYHKIHNDGVLYRAEKLLRANNGDFLVIGTQKAVGESYQPFLMRTDTAFNSLWVKTLARDNWTFCYDFVELPDRNIIAVGETYDTENGDLDQLIVKFNENGDVVNVMNSALTGNDGFVSIEKWNDHSLLVAGYQQDTITLDTIPMFGFLDFDGNVQMRRTFGDVAPKSTITRAQRGSNDQIMLFGYTHQFRTENRDPLWLCFDSNGTFRSNQASDITYWANGTCTYHSAAFKENGDIFIAIQTSGGDFLHESIHLHHQRLHYPDFYFERSSNIVDSDDDLFVSQIIATNDGTLAVIGTTFASETHNADILFAKINDNFDEMLENDAHYISEDDTQPVSIRNFELETPISLFPNPASSVLTIRDQQPSGETATIELFDAKMQLLARWQHHFTENPDFQMNVTHYPSGFYVINVRCGDRHFTKKVIIL